MEKLYFLFFILLTNMTFSQEDAWVYFNAKANEETYYASPLEMLSQRALDRRSNQKISLDFKDIPINLTYINQIKAISGITVMAKSKWLNAIHVRGTQTLINSIKSLSFVEKVDFANKTLNQTGKTAKIFQPKQNLNKIQKTKIEYAYGNSAQQIEMLNGQLLHQENYTGAGKIIAVLDAGFIGVNTTAPFKQLRDNNQILGGYNYVNRNTNIYALDSHGTSVLSTMGGYVENSLIGTAPDASYYLFITEDDFSENPVEESLWVEAAEKADSLGVDIINTSLGYFEFDNPAYSHTYSEMNGTTAFISKGAEIAFSRGMIVVASAGNEGATSNPHIGAPADAVSVITVGAVSSNETRASFSSIGPSFDQRIKPDVMAQGVSTVLSNQSGNIVTAQGTSFSSPVTAGVVACLWQALPNKTNQQIKDLIIQSADRYLVPDNQYGYGIPDFGLALENGLVIENMAREYFVAYPNPTTDFVTVDFPEGFNSGTVIFYSALGKKVLEKQVNNEQDRFSLNSLSRGVYFYKIENDTFSKKGKIIKQ
jgi:subtilisin family serine protease